MEALGGLKILLKAFSLRYVNPAWFSQAFDQPFCKAFLGISSSLLLGFLSQTMLFVIQLTQILWLTSSIVAMSHFLLRAFHSCQLDTITSWGRCYPGMMRDLVFVSDPLIATWRGAWSRQAVAAWLPLSHHIMTLFGLLNHNSWFCDVDYFPSLLLNFRYRTEEWGSFSKGKMKYSLVWNPQLHM